MQDCFMFKDKPQELIDKNNVELNAEMKATTTNVVFVEKEMVNLVDTQDSRNDGDEGNKTTSEGKKYKKDSK